MISIQLYSKEIGTYYVSRETAVMALRDVEREEKMYGAQATKITGDRETIREYLLLNLDALRDSLGEKLTNSLIENIDQIMDAVYK